MTRDEVAQLANEGFHNLPNPPAGAAFILIAVDTLTGAYQLRVANMDVTYLVGLLQRCANGVDRATAEAHEAIRAEHIKTN